jgi:peptide/nickel transport system ATP-binding protein
MTAPLLELIGVNKTFGTGDHEVHAAIDVNLAVAPGECLAIVGESGSGKTTLANMILGIYQQTSGRIVFDGEDLPAKRRLEHRRNIQLVQQNPLSSLNPKRSVGASVRLGLDVYGIGERRERWALVEQALQEVGLPPEFRKRAPGALSGGQRQRVAIARALACQSRLVVLDEPTSALDVLVQARVLKLLNDLRAKKGLTFFFITHDLSVVRNVADRVAVFQSGRLVECEPTEEIFENPRQSYTRQLIGAVPVIADEELRLREKLAEETAE